MNLMLKSLLREFVRLDLLTESHDIKALARAAYISVINGEETSAAVSALEDSLEEQGMLDELEELRDPTSRIEVLRDLAGMERGVRRYHIPSVPRILTPTEARERANQLALPQVLVTAIVDAFDSAEDYKGNYDSPRFLPGGRGVGKNGRLIVELEEPEIAEIIELLYNYVTPNQDDDGVELAGGVPANPQELIKTPQIARIWNAFFEDDSELEE